MTPPQDSKQEPRLREEGQPGPLKILVADDTPTNLLLTTRLLERKGHAVHTVENGQQALEAVQREPFDLILMDIHMPVVDGLEAARKIRQWEEDHPVKNPRKRTAIIALTADNDEDDQTIFKEAGMDGWVKKPLDIKTALADILKILNNIRNLP